MLAASWCARPVVRRLSRSACGDAPNAACLLTPSRKCEPGGAGIPHCTGAGAMSCRLAPLGVAPLSSQLRQSRLARALPLKPAVLCISRVPRERRIALEVELEVVRDRAQSVAARGRRLSEKAMLLRQGEARAAAEGDAAMLARLQRDRKVVLYGLSAVLRRVRCKLSRCPRLR